MGFLGGSDGKESACHAGDPGLIPELGRSPEGGKWLPNPVFLPGEFYGQRSLVGYSPWGRRESDTTERLSTAHLLTIRDSTTVIKQGERTETLALKRPITESWSISYLSDVLM